MKLMRLSRALQKVGVTFWRKMAGYYDLTHLEFSSNRLYQALLKSLRDPEIIGKVMSELPDNDEKLLKAIVLAQSNGSFYDVRHWKKYSAYLNPSNEEDPFVGLKDRGLIYTNEEEQIYSPIEIRDAVLKVLEKSAKEVDYVDEDILFNSGGIRAVGDTIRFLDIVRKEEIRVTQANQLYKRDQEIFFERLDIDQEKELNIGSRLDFLFRLSELTELAIVKDGDLSLTKDIDDWFSQPSGKIWRHIYEFWTTQYPETPEARVAQQVLVGVISNLIGEGTAMKDELFKLFESCGGVVPVQSQNSDWWQNTINELIYLGIMRMGTFEEKQALKVNENAIELMRDPETDWMEEDTFILKNDYQIIVTPYISPKILWDLSEMTEDQGSKEIYSYKITKGSIYHALLQGTDSKEIIEFFNIHSKTGLPDNIQQSINDWAKRFGQIYFLDACLLSCKKQSLVKEILNTPEMAQYVVGNVNENVLLINREDYVSLLEELEERGYMPYKDLYNAKNMPFSPLKNEEE
jgi:hypothetical protein